MSLKEIFLSGLKDSKVSGGSILRQPSRRITDKTNRDSTVISNNPTTDSSVSMSRSALSTRTMGGNEQSSSQHMQLNTGSVSNNNQNVASSVSLIF